MGGLAVRRSCARELAPLNIVAFRLRPPCIFHSDHHVRLPPTFNPTPIQLLPLRIRSYCNPRGSYTSFMARFVISALFFSYLLGLISLSLALPSQLDLNKATQTLAG